MAREASMIAPGDAVARHGAGGDDLISFARAVPDPSTYPAERFRTILQAVLRREGPSALGYGPPAGYPRLREIIATRASEQGGNVHADDVLIVGGSQQGLDLLARLLVSRGDTVVVERPTYANALHTWRLYGAGIVGVPLDADGIATEPLAAALRRGSAKLVYLMPTFQNPTGLTMDESRRRDVMRIAREAEVPVVEDHFDSDLRYRGVPLPPLRAYDRAGQVILLGTFSKILFPGFRLGWIVAPRPIRERLIDLKLTCDLASSLPAQIAVADFCQQGELDRHLDRVRTEHAGRLSAMLASIDAHFPAGIRVTRPQGGMTLWVTLPAGADSVELLEEARAAGVSFAPGVWFFPDAGGREHLRLSFVSEPPDRIRSGVATLGAVLKRHLARRSARARRSQEEPMPFL